MGLLVEGKPLTPEEMKDASKYIREHGVDQFIATWRRVKDLKEDVLRFGDEIEIGVFVIDNEKKTVKLTTRSAELRAILSEKEDLFKHESEGCTWHPEFGAWMIESTPSRPYSNYATDLLRVERNMVLRRRRILSVLNSNEIIPSIPCFPLLGAGDYIYDAKPFSAPHSQSNFIPDYIINPHPRFAALTRNIRARRGSKVDIRVPLFPDSRTPEFQMVTAQSSAAVPEASLPAGYEMEPDTDIHMDAMGFGMGMCCLQVTFQARDIDESRYMYDQLAVLAPIMLAMTAATPIFKGRLADVDVRWSAIAQSVDDRTPTERGELTATAANSTSSISDSAISAAASSNSAVVGVADARMAGGGVQHIPKSRYDSISTYIYHCRGETDCHRTFEVYNDIPCPIDATLKAKMRDAGIDENLAHHVAHLFCRDPISAFHGQIELDDNSSTDHFESLQSTNWQTCRWKPPPPLHSPSDPHIGWRTEFRSMEVQLTDFENAAFTVFVVLLTRVVLAFDLSLYIPLSKVDENMRRAHLRDAVNTQRFYFRKFVAPSCHDSAEEVATAATAAAATAGSGDGGEDGGDEFPTHNTRGPCGVKRTEEEDGSNLGADDMFTEMTMTELFTGKGSYFPGLLPLVYAYLDFINCDPRTYRRIDSYLQFIEKRARGELLTPATWMRNFVRSHGAYQMDSVVSPEIAHDLMKACHDIGTGAVHCPELLGDMKIERVRAEDAYGQILTGKLTRSEKSTLLKTLALRAHTVRPVNLARGKSRGLTFDETERLTERLQMTQQGIETSTQSTPAVAATATSAMPAAANDGCGKMP